MITRNGDLAVAPKGRKWFNFKELFFGIQQENGNGNGAKEAERTALPVYLRPVVVATMNQKGGCGKTTTVVNLSAALAKEGYRVLVADMDPQAHASLSLGVVLGEYHRSIYDLMLDENTKFGDIIHATSIRGLDVLPSSMKLSGAQMELANAPRGESALKRCLRDAEKHYDFVFIDCPPTLNMLTLNALVYAKKVLVPVQTHYYALEGMKELFRTIEAVRKRFNPSLEILGILATLFDKRVTIAVDMLGALNEHFKTQMFQTVINMNVKLIEAPMARESVITYAPKSAASRNYRALAGEVIGAVVRAN